MTHTAHPIHDVVAKSGYSAKVTMLATGVYVWAGPEWVGHTPRPLNPENVEDFGIAKLPGFDAEVQTRAHEKYTADWIAEYRASMAARTAEMIAEERAEARAAFGPGENIVNVITGERYTT